MPRGDGMGRARRIESQSVSAGIMRIFAKDFPADARRRPNTPPSLLDRCNPGIARVLRTPDPQ